MPALPQAERNRMRWQGSDGAIELRDWFALCRRRGGGLGRPSAMPRRCAPPARPPSWSSGWRCIEGRAHGLPGYAEALAVQQTIEALLAGR